MKIKSLTLKQKILGAVIIAGIAAAVLAGNLFMQANKFVPLYSQELSMSDLNVVKAELTNMKIPYRTDSTGRIIMVHPSEVNNAMAVISFHISRKRPDKKSIMEIERQIINVMKNTDGVADCFIKTKIPDNGQGPITVTVALKLKPGVRFSIKQATGIAYLVVSSMPADVKDIEIVDINGNPYKINKKLLNIYNENTP